MEVWFEKLHAAGSGEAWAKKWAEHWPNYKRWFLSQGLEARETYWAGRRAVSVYMPELLATYDRLCDLAGGGDLASRYLSFYSPPPYLAGCSQAVWLSDNCRLVRNYDYDLTKLDATVVHSHWGDRQVLALTDGLWGVVDGMNDAGLAVSLTFGGRQIVGRGFGIPIILRYVLELCETVTEAKEALWKVPCHMAYNVTVLDRWGDYVTAYLVPNRRPVFARTRVATNHQETVEWHQHARLTATVEREQFLLKRLTLGNDDAEGFVSAFLHPPLYSTAFSQGFGTAYTSVYLPAERRMEIRWPGKVWHHDFVSPFEPSQLISYP